MNNISFKAETIKGKIIEACCVINKHNRLLLSNEAKAYGEHKVVKWDEDRAEFLLDLDGQKFWSNPFRVQNCG